MLEIRSVSKNKDELHRLNRKIADLKAKEQRYLDWKKRQPEVFQKIHQRLHDCDAVAFFGESIVNVVSDHFYKHGEEPTHRFIDRLIEMRPMITTILKRCNSAPEMQARLARIVLEQDVEKIRAMEVATRAMADLRAEAKALGVLALVEQHARELKLDEAIAVVKNARALREREEDLTALKRREDALMAHGTYTPVLLRIEAMAAVKSDERGYRKARYPYAKYLEQAEAKLDSIKGK